MPDSLICFVGLAYSRTHLCIPGLVEAASVAAQLLAFACLDSWSHTDTGLHARNSWLRALTLADRHASLTA